MDGKPSFERALSTAVKLVAAGVPASTLFDQLLAVGFHPTVAQRLLKVAAALEAEDRTKALREAEKAKAVALQEAEEAKAFLSQEAWREAGLRDVHRVERALRALREGVWDGSVVSLLVPFFKYPVSADILREIMHRCPETIPLQTVRVMREFPDYEEYWFYDDGSIGGTSPVSNAYIRNWAREELVRRASVII